MKKGMIYVFTGDGKGKTSAALGMVIRALSHEMKVGWVSWYKEEKWKMGELGLKGKIEMYFTGKGFYNLPTDKVSFKKHKAAAIAGLKQAEKLIKKVDVLVLDEINNVVKDDLIDIIELIELISDRKKTHLILTGRSVNKRIVELANLVTECKKVKHPFDKGVKAIKGLDY